MEKFGNKPWESEHLRSKSETLYKGRFQSLQKIVEVEEWVSSVAESVKIPSVPKKQYMKRQVVVHTEPVRLSDDPQVAGLQDFLFKLQQNMKVYELFVSCGISNNVLKQYPCRSQSYYYKYIHNPNTSRYKLTNRANVNQSEDYGIDSFEQNVTISSDNNSEQYFVYENDTRPKFTEFLRSLRVNSEVPKEKPMSRASKPKSRASNPRRRNKPKIKRQVLDRNNPKLITIYQIMCQAQFISLKSCRLTNFLFKQYLSKKFHPDIAEQICRHFEFKSANFEDFCAELDRFLLAPEAKLMTLCFDAFDFNKDKYICYQDTYSAIKYRTEDLYDADLIKLNAMLEMKKKGIMPLKRVASRKGRRMSVMSLVSELSMHDENQKKKEVPHVHPEKPEAITFEDFCRIEFKGKPQILYSLFLYICNYDINKCQEISTPVIKSRQQSEDLIIELSENPLIEKSEYLVSLETSMDLFRFTHTRDLLNKFEILRDKTLDSKLISKSSMIENWPKLFGASSAYISERYFYYFTNNKNYEITKPHFLTAIHGLLTGDRSPRVFSFDFYDKKADEKLTSDEVYCMEQALIENTPIHDECSKLVDELIAGIFEKKIMPTTIIDRNLFNEVVGVSLFYTEIIRVINTPMAELLNLPNPSWNTRNN